jgi:hypothetical protein
MRFAPEALVLFLGAVGASAQASGPSQTPSPSPSPLPSPSPTPKYRLLPYAFEEPQPPMIGQSLRFEDRAEVLGIEMNAAIARFFDKDGNGDMTRGATPGGAPSLAEMKNYRPHMSPSIDFLTLAKWAASLGKGAISRSYRSRVERNEELLRALLLGEYPTPTPTPAASPSPSPSVSPSPRPSPTR